MSENPKFFERITQQIQLMLHRNHHQLDLQLLELVPPPPPPPTVFNYTVATQCKETKPSKNDREREYI